MRGNVLDDTDRQILRVLRDNARISNVDLAKAVGISPPPCLRRVRALEDAGFIDSFTSQLNATAMGYPVTAFCHVGLHSQAEPDLEAFETLVGNWDPVRECHMLMGNDDFLLKVVAPSVDSLNAFIVRKLTPAPNVKNVKTAIAIRKSLIKPSVPVKNAQQFDEYL